MSPGNETIRSLTSPTDDSKAGELSTEALWQASLTGDRDAFQRLIKPYVEELLTAARRDIRYHLAVGDLRQGDLSAEELVGDTLLRAWRDRAHRPNSLDIRPWLLGLQFRVLTRIVRQEVLQRKLLAVSLEAPAPAGLEYDDEESFWEWYQPDQALRWEDIVAADTPAWEEEPELFENVVPGLSPLARQVLTFRHIHRFSVREVASTLGLSARRVSELWLEGSALLVSARKYEK